MRASRQVKRLIAKLRRRFGKRNGVVRSCHLDGVEFLRANDKKERKAIKEKYGKETTR